MVQNWIFPKYILYDGVQKQKKFWIRLWEPRDLFAQHFTKLKKNGPNSENTSLNPLTKTIKVHEKSTFFKFWSSETYLNCSDRAHTLPHWLTHQLRRLWTFQPDLISLTWKNPLFWNQEQTTRWMLERLRSTSRNYENDEKWWFFNVSVPKTHLDCSDRL